MKKKPHQTWHRLNSVPDSAASVITAVQMYNHMWPAPAQPFLPGSSEDDAWDQKQGMHTTAGHYCSLQCKWAPRINRILLLWLSTRRGLGPFQSFLIESMKQIK